MHSRSPHFEWNYTNAVDCFAGQLLARSVRISRGGSWNHCIQGDWQGVVRTLWRNIQLYRTWDQQPEREIEVISHHIASI